MSSTDPHKFALPLYSYAQAEAALAAVFGVDPERRGPLKGRLKHLNTLGLPGLKVGRGVRIAYTFEQVAQWLIALVIEEAGVDPTVAVGLVKGGWEQVTRPAVLAAMDEPRREVDHIFLVFRPRLMTGLWAKGTSAPDTEPVLGFLRHWRKDKETGKPVNAAEEAIAWGVKTKTWLCLRDLTVDFEILTAALDGEKP
jgi:hypothetical protein